jgi:uncharacterized membrane protein
MTVSEKAKLAWHVTMLLYACLLVGLTLDHTVVRHAFYWPVWLMQTIPLLLVLPGLLQRRARSGTLLCFIILFHLLAAIDNAAASGHMVFYSCMATIVLALFTTSLLFVRWQRLQISE